MRNDQDEPKPASAEHEPSSERPGVAGSFFASVVALLCLYVFFLEGMEQYRARRAADTFFVDLPLQLLFGAASIWFIRRSGRPLADFGIGVRHLFRALLEAVLFTIPVLLVVTGAKWVLQGLVASDRPLLANPDVVVRLLDPGVRWPVTVYAISAGVQELIVRGTVQSSLQRWLDGPRASQMAIVVAALLFGVTHLHIGFVIAMLTVPAGLFWGWLFARQPNLVGVFVSHASVGIWVFFVMGLSV